MDAASDGEPVLLIDEAVDTECAFCGRSTPAVRQVFCDDCQTQHAVCTRCVEEVLSEAEGYRLVA